MMSAHPSRQWSLDDDAAGTVVVHPGAGERDPHSHECMTHCVAAERLAAILGYRFAGLFDASGSYGNRLYFVPSDTLIGADGARRLGVESARDIFGGVVPHSFVATKTITHGLIDADARMPEGWSRDFAVRVRDAVLPGFSAFHVPDALRAGRLLLEQGEIRIKKASGIGGLGQTVAGNAMQLQEQLEAIAVEEVLRDGLVLECNLAQVKTQSVGQVRVGAMTASYYGTQRLTHNNRGVEVYGGSELIVARGDFDALLKLDLDAPMRIAVEQARVYHAAAMRCFPGMFASRCNYDIAQGIDADGRWRSGVLEQSWRIGGATGAEIAALEVFLADPDCHAVCASTTEVYGDNVTVPPDAVVYYAGVDAKVGKLTKYAQLHA